ncbi:bifunctional diguanylate cyclase/phosphodiesterase [Shewanella sp. MEBiC00475]|uniref:putative bifunctional diguanylate cyclase/phosphodiesterase n=1 Tax=Shewanella sp. MEBiC00475 TaxID=2575361 RepID=UPI001C3010B9|nr:EAL domain-containing protein [Shewanella sp. MEBiC00475]
MTVKMEHRTIEDKILLGITAAATLVLFPFLVLSIISQDKAHIIVDSIAVGGFSIIFLGVWFTSKIRLFSGIFAVIAHVNILIGIYIKGAGLIYWLFPIIIASYYLLPTIVASLFNFFLITIASYLTFEQFDHFTLPRIISALVVTNVFALIFSVFMQNKNHQLLEKDKISQLRNNILELIASSSQLSKVLHAIVLGIENEFPDAKCSILLLDKNGKRLMLGSAPSLPDFYNEAIDGLVIGKGVGSCSEAALTGERVIVTDIATHPNWTHCKDIAQKASLVSCWSEPIIGNSGNVLGTFGIYHHKITSPKEIEFTLIEQFTNLARIAIEREKADKLIWKQANYDSLTNLPNRNLLHEHLTSAIANAHRESKQLVIAMMDLDNFKDVNDSMGHSAGDIVLIECAKRIKNCLRRNDIVARLGGDEFIIVMMGTMQTKDIDIIGQKLISTLANPYVIEGKKVFCTASIGLAFYPDDATSIDGLLVNADQAMYRAKTQGRNGIHYFTENMRTDFLKRIEIIQDLRIAVAENQFHMVYQPIVNLENNQIVKAEALIRWLHPDKGLIPPLDFIHVAEEIGLIIEISEWIFNEVSQQANVWRNAYCPNLCISINTSPVQYKNEGKQIKAWADSLIAQDISPQAIAIEITEHLLMDNQAEVVDALEAIRMQGVAISIDDFGTGYSSFSYLKNYTIDYLKIDQSFVQNMSDNNKDIALCEAIIVMANKLNIKVIAEGIETEQQKQLLIQAGCHFGQGYLLSKPLSVADFEKLLVKQNTND